MTKVICLVFDIVLEFDLQVDESQRTVRTRHARFPRGAIRSANSSTSRHSSSDECTRATKHALSPSAKAQWQFMVSI
ncbi:unnamed protein product [Arabis nemorensis]|uniref:Uncharacterized protein n=1 Tax=Arabis nemorensis TaxID=586526 RepID=A0A565CT04_9BRAS|nr:unnamed protein product [Arabis nemorensis]